jgi:DNA-binding response OmpR family regulator
MDKNRILIIDDEADLVETLQARLEQENYECLTAYDGYNGLQLARNEKPDLIILDIMLPAMDGYKIARLLKFQKELKHIPIIMLSAKDRPEDQLLGEQTGADFYVTKPFSVEKLLGTVKGFLQE